MTAPTLSRPRDPAFARPALVGLLAATAVLYLWGLGASDWANSYYSAAAQAGSQSWKAWFFAASDAGGSITVDKTPASVWVMGLSVRLFGLSSWSLLVPQALMGVATVGFTHASVRRWFGAAPALIAGTVVALTPVAVLMFRFNNPDALLVLTLAMAAWAITRAVESGRTGWVAAAFALVGVGFMAKMFQAFLVVPPLGFAYLLAGPPRLARRIGQLAVGAVALVVSSGWWIVVVELWPASSRPYVGGSQTNSVLDLLFGYNGFGRLTGNETGSVGGGAGGGGPSWGSTGLTRLFGTEMGAQASWLLPAALIVLVVGLAATARAARTDRTRAALMVWGGWLVVTGLTFSLGEGIIHEYYTVALAPAIGALVGIGVARWWPRRTELGARAVLSGTVAVTAWWSWVLLGRVPDWAPALRPAVLVGGLLIAGLLLVPPARSRVGRRAGGAIGAAALAAVLAGPTAYALSTAATPHTGSIVLAGPTTTGGMAGGPGGG
ncbi:MAG TPA: glycosyltransferase family 39 protein, partial [Iamia sp.]